MAVGYNPRVVTDGLVLALDAGSPKNYNAGISTNWTDKIGGNNGTLVGGTNHNDGPFVGAGYVEFDGTGDYVDIASSSDFIFDGDFTIEYWIYREGGNVWFDLSNTSDYTNAINFYSSSGNLLFYMGGTPAINVGGAGYMDVPTNQWVHHAVSRSGTTCRVFADGVLKKTTTLSGTAGNDTRNILRLGAQSYGGPTAYFQGKLSNLRIVKGTALYTSNFTPPTKSLTAVTNTVLLTCQGNTIADASSSAHTITANGDISLTKEPFAGAGAVKFDGSGDYLTTANHASDFNFGSSDFTMEFWANSTKTGRTDPIGWNYHYNSTGWAGMILNISPGSGSMAWYENSSSRISGSGSWNDGSWHHIAVTRDGNSVRMFLDGTQIGSTYTTSHSYGAASSGLIIGALQQSLGSGPMDGQISNVRVLKGTALYTSAFTPPSRTLEPIENTVLLTCQGQNIKDASSNAHTITPNGNVKPTIVSSSFEFDGVDDHITLSSSQIAPGTGAFTWNFWAKHIPTGQTSPDTYSVVFSGTGSNTLYGVITMDSATYGLTYYANGYQITDNNTAFNSDWWYISFVGNGGVSGSRTLKLYRNGVQAGSTYTYDYNFTSTTPVIGRNHSYFPEVMRGNISNVSYYNRELTAEEIQQNYNATKGRYA